MSIQNNKTFTTIFLILWVLLPQQVFSKVEAFNCNEDEIFEIGRVLRAVPNNLEAVFSEKHNNFGERTGLSKAEQRKIVQKTQNFEIKCVRNRFCRRGAYAYVENRNNRRVYICGENFLLDGNLCLNAKVIFHEIAHLVGLDIGPKNGKFHLKGQVARFGRAVFNMCLDEGLRGKY